MAKVICIGNHKGGVGKTTVTANLGALLSQMGKKVLLIDLDAQANSTDYFLPQRPETSVYNSLTEEIPLPVIRCGLSRPSGLSRQTAALSLNFQYNSH